MLNETTMTKLRAMKLQAIGDAFNDQFTDKIYEQMPFEDRFGILVDMEWTRRENNRLGRLIKNAGFPMRNACLEDLDFSTRNIDKNLMASLSTCNFIFDRRNLLILGPTGGGKTFLATSLGMAAVRKKLAAKYYKTPDLLTELAVARGEGTLRKLFKQLTKIPLLILDEWLLFPLTVNEARDIFDLLEYRKDFGAVLICSQFEVKGWHSKIGEDCVADAICDRISAKSTTIRLEPTESMRRTIAKRETAQTTDGNF
jgi:DNA replication protein DnaC